MKHIYSALLATVIAVPALADSHSMGDADAGEKQFGKCKACHMIVDDAGETFQRGGKVGPNLYGIIGKQAGTVDDYRYVDDLVFYVFPNPFGKFTLLLLFQTMLNLPFSIP